MKTISVDGFDVCYTTCGQGPCLVLLHGTNNDGRATFGHVADCWADRRTVVTVDYGGCGQSTIPAGGFSLEAAAQQATEAVRDASGQPVDLLGYSLGAVVASTVAAKNPDLVRQLILVAGWADSDDARHKFIFETWLKLDALDPALGARYGMSLALSPQFFSTLTQEQVSRFFQRQPDVHMRQRIALGLASDLRSSLGKITAPTLVVGLTRDYLVPTSQVRVLHSGIRNSNYKEVDCGHAVFAEEPAKLVQLVREFLR